MSTNSFRGTAPQCVDLNPLDFYLRGHLKTLVYSAPIENEQALRQHIFDGCQTLRNRSAISERARVYDQTCFLVRELIQMEDILSMCCEF